MSLVFIQKTSGYNKEAKDEEPVAHNNEPVMKSITPNKKTQLLGCQNQ
jgi:hypothetical protein